MMDLIKIYDIKEEEFVKIVYVIIKINKGNIVLEFFYKDVF